MKLNVDLIYPVGSIYITTSTISPQTLFGGTWEPIPYRYLVGVGRITPNSNNILGSVDEYVQAGYQISPEESFGEIFHKLTVQEMPSHSHAMPWHTNTGGYRGFNGWNDACSYDSTSSSYPVGGNQAHNNLPPSLAVYMWRRTA